MWQNFLIRILHNIYEIGYIDEAESNKSDCFFIITQYTNLLLKFTEEALLSM